MAKKGRILTGHRPTGPRHLGHLVGTLETWARLQDDYECYFLIADWHVLTTDVEHTAEIENNLIEMIYDWLAAGLDPQRSVFVQQSLVKEHAELALLLGNLVTVSRLQRNPTFKEQVTELHLGRRASLGLLAYPVLQTADILVYKADTVPVGEDQVPHLELSREIARKFNITFKTIFPEPQPYLSAIPRLPGTDNRKMGSSYDNFIALRSPPEEIREKVMNMYTDPTRIHPTDPGHVEGNPVFLYHDAFNTNKEQVEEFKVRYRQGKIGDVEVKRVLAEVLIERLRPFREIREELKDKPGHIKELVVEGSRRAREVAEATMDEVREAMHAPFRK